MRQANCRFGSRAALRTATQADDSHHYVSVVPPTGYSRHGCVVGSPKMCRMESNLTLPRVVRGAEKLGSGYGLVG
jgi:hypothetical protein